MNRNVSGKSVERFADIEILRYSIDSFEKLNIRQKLFLYHLVKASEAGRDITWLQNLAEGIGLRNAFEKIYQRFILSKKQIELTTDEEAFVTYLYQMWFSNGIHHHYSGSKFEPKFDKEWFTSLLSQFDYSEKELQRIIELVFNPFIYPFRSAPVGSTDVIGQTSADFYRGHLTEDEIKNYYDHKQEKSDQMHSFGVISRLEKIDDKIIEKPYAIQSTHGDSIYCRQIEKVVTHLQSAIEYCESDKQKEDLNLLIKVYENGNVKDYDEFWISWVQTHDGLIDYINGFVETYTDPTGYKAMWESILEIKDIAASEKVNKMAAMAGWFEEHSPIPSEYKKKNPKGITATIIDVALLAGDSFPSAPIGVNLPNQNWIRTEYGSKSVTIANLHQAYDIAAEGNGVMDELIQDKKLLENLKKYGAITSELHTNLHECLGHGSGKLKEGVDAAALGKWHSTIEEARADLYGLYFIADKKMVELGVLPNEEAYKTGIYKYFLNGLITQLARLNPGEKIQEAHMQDRALISRWILEDCQKTGAMVFDGFSLTIHDYQEVRKSIGRLLHIIQKIKSEGDAVLAEKLIKQYAIDVPEQTHTYIRNIFEKHKIAPYKGFLNPRYVLVKDEKGNTLDVELDYSESYSEQMLRLANPS